MAQGNYSVDYVLKLKALMHDPIHKIWLFSEENRNTPLGFLERTNFKVSIR